MADVLSAVRTYLLSKTAITDVIGQRMYFDRRPQGSAMPATTLTKVSERQAHTLSDLAGIVHSRLQIDCYSTSRLTSNSLAKSISTCGIAAVKGLTNSVDIRGVTVEDGQRNFSIDDPDGGDDHTYVTQFDLLVSYLE